MERIPHEFLEMMMCDDKPKPQFKCLSCKQIGFSFDPSKQLGIRSDQFEVCRVCGIVCNYTGKTASSGKSIKQWRAAWKECGSKVFYDMPLPERMNYFNEVYDCVYRKENFVLSEEDRIARKLDKRLFTDNSRKLPFVNREDKKLVITCDSGERWEIPYETNKIFDLDEDKRYVMLLEYADSPVILGSEYLSVLPSVRNSYPGLTPDLFSFVGAFRPDCKMKDKSGNEYTVAVEDR